MRKQICGFTKNRGCYFLYGVVLLNANKGKDICGDFQNSPRF